ncbi:MAG: glycosyltransferase [Actinobacteria bacterium]|nr:glycosyltransferase [Actinomycetota bacterium]
MRILVYPHDLGMGGSQLNAIEIAGKVRDLGHEIVVFGHPGTLNSRVAELGLEFIASPRPRRRPTPTIIAELRRLTAIRRLDVLHGYEWPPILEANVACAGLAARAVGTVMSMSVAPFLPRQMLLAVGTEQIAEVERNAGRTNVTVIEPPVDTEGNAPDPQKAAQFRQEWGLADDSLVVVVVSRLAHEMKLEGILTAIAVTAELDGCAQLVIVGDGPATDEVDQAVALANRRAGRTAVVRTGELYDPRPAYAGADVVLGMGGSALRALAFAKPLIVQGERGFWRTLCPTSLPDFLWTGWYGVGEGVATGPDRLRSQLQPLLSNPLERARLGNFGRDLVVSRYSLQAAAVRQIELYEASLAAPPQLLVDLRSSLEAAISFSSFTAGRVISGWRGTRRTDDFNAQPALIRDRREQT